MKLKRLGLTIMLVGLTVVILTACDSEKSTNPSNELDGLSIITSPQSNNNNQSASIPTTVNPTVSSQSGQYPSIVSQPGSSSGSQIKTKSYYGTWIIRKHIPTHNVSALSNEDIANYIGEKIIIDEHQIVTNAGIIKNPIFNEKTVTNSEFYWNWKIQFSNIGITGDTVTQVDVSNYKNETANGIGSNFIITKDNKIYTSIGGVFFELGN